MMMTPREVRILEALIKDFIETGEPVSSREISRNYRFGVKDATIRNELNHLMREGYLEQPHTSSGRVPTDKAYRLWADQLVRGIFEEARREVELITSSLEREFRQGEFGEVVGEVADELKVLGVGYAVNDGELYRSGLRDLFEKLMSDSWTSDPREMYQVVEDFEMLEERIKEILSFVVSGDEPRVFIGRSPITKSKQLSVIAGRYEIDGDEFVLAAVGPKRMDYERNIRFFRELKGAFRN